MIAIIKAMLVLVILVAMVMILLGTNQLFTGNLQTEEEDTNSFRNDVNDKEDVLTSQNLFRKFLGR